MHFKAPGASSRNEADPGARESANLEAGDKGDGVLSPSQEKERPGSPAVSMLPTVHQA
jgi:hypothetical protein